MSQSSSPPLPIADDMPFLVRQIIDQPMTCLFGYHGVRAQVCEAAAWFANRWEAERVDWRITLLSGSYRLSLRNFGEIASLIEFPFATRGDSFVRGQHGIVRATYADIGAIVGTMGDRVLWFVDEGVPDGIWDYIVQEVSILSDSHPDVERLIAINPPMERYHLFGEEVSR